MVEGPWPWGPRDLFFGVQRVGPYIRRRGAGPSCRMSCECGPSCVGAERSPGFSPLHSNAFLPGRAYARRDGVRPSRERGGDYGEHIVCAAREEPLERPLVSLTGIEISPLASNVQLLPRMFVEPVELTFEQNRSETKPALHLAAAESPFSQKYQKSL